MWIWLLLPLVFAGGYYWGKWQNRDYQSDAKAKIEQRFIVLTLRTELLAYTQKPVGAKNCSKKSISPFKQKLVKPKPNFRWYQRLFLSLMHRFFPETTRFNQLKPATLIKWQKEFSSAKFYQKILNGKRKQNRPQGRPPMAQHIIDAVIGIKKENPSYGNAKIASLVANQLLESISDETVRKILKKHGVSPNPVGNGKKLGQKLDPSWAAYFYYQFYCAMDFKVTLDMRGVPLFILNIVDHGRRQLILSRATYHPTSAWVAQQLRNCIGLDYTPEVMVMDHDKIFYSIAKTTLPAMGVKVMRTGIKCPWQNAVVERFNRTMTEELLDYVIPFNEQHMNRLLSEYQTYYNTARPHMTNGGSSPIAVANDTHFTTSHLSLNRLSGWVACTIVIAGLRLSCN